MPEPELRSDDVFHIIGYTGQDILDGALLHSMKLSDHNLKMMDSLNQLFGSLPIAARRGLVVNKQIEVYFVDAFVDDGTFRKAYSKKYQTVHFYNDTAFRLSNQCQIRLPPVIKKLNRAELPRRFGTSMRGECYILNES